MTLHFFVQSSVTIAKSQESKRSAADAILQEGQAQSRVKEYIWQNVLSATNQKGPFNTFTHHLILPAV